MHQDSKINDPQFQLLTTVTTKNFQMPLTTKNLKKLSYFTKSLKILMLKWNYSMMLEVLSLLFLTKMFLDWKTFCQNITVILALSLPMDKISLKYKTSFRRENKMYLSSDLMLLKIVEILQESKNYFLHTKRVTLKIICMPSLWK